MKMHSTSFEHCSGSFLCGIQDAAECRSSCAPPVQQNIFPLLWRKFRSPDKIILQLEHSYFVCVLVVTLCQKPPSNVMIYLCRTLIYHQIYICIYSFCYLPFPSSLYLLIQLIIYTDLDGDITQ